MGPTVQLCEDDPQRHRSSLPASTTVLGDLTLPASPWDLSAAPLAWVGTIADVETGTRAVEALSRGVGLVLRVTLRGRDRQRLLEDLHVLGEVRTPDDPPRPPALDDDQRALIGLLATGATLTDAARELHLSRRTANRRMGEIREALHVATTAEAVIEWAALS